MRLKDKVAIVAGGCSSLGRAIAIHFAAEGARVVVADRDERAGNDVVETILESDGDATFSHADLTDEDQIQSMVGDSIVAYGNIDVLVHALAHRVYKDALTLTREEWEQSLKVNLESAWLCARYCAPFLKTSGRGSIVLVASTHALRSMPRHFPYATSKGALLALSRALAIDFGPQNIRSNVLIPGYIQSDHGERRLRESPAPEENFHRILSVHPLGRVGAPEDVARAAAFLAGDDASFITGTTLCVDGGRGAVIQDLHDW